MAWTSKYSFWLAGMASLLVLSLSAQAAFPIPGSAVPVTLQSLVVVLIPVLMGGRAGAVVLMGYLLLGGFGLPVFAGGASGWEKFTGASAG
ncbi:MAG: biotin transporter BioY, partial [Bacteroidota bacterium]